MRGFIGFLTGLNFAGLINSVAHDWTLLAVGEAAVTTMLIMYLIFTRDD